MLIMNLIYTKLAWEPSFPQVTHSYTRRLPALDRKLRFLLFFPIKVDPLNLDSENQLKNIPVVLPSSTNKQTDRQTEITTLFI